MSQLNSLPTGVQPLDRSIAAGQFGHKCAGGILLTLINRMRGWAEQLWLLSNNMNIVVVVFYTHWLVCTLKLCLLRHWRGPRENRATVYCSAVKTPPDPSTTVPLSLCRTSRVPTVPATLEFRSAGGVNETAPWAIVTGGLGESHFVFALGTKHHATENSQSIVMRQRNPN